MLEKYPDIYVIADEIYEHINFTEGHFSMGTIPSMKDRTITVNGVVQRICYDRLACWFYWRTTLDSKGL